MVPLVFVSIVCGTAALDDATKLGRVGGRTLGLYLLTTAVAISLGILIAVAVGLARRYTVGSTLLQLTRIV